MNDFEDTWPTEPMHLRTGITRPDPRPFWTPIILVVAAMCALAVLL